MEIFVTNRIGSSCFARPEELSHMLRWQDCTLTAAQHSAFTGRAGAVDNATYSSWACTCTGSDAVAGSRSSEHSLDHYHHQCLLMLHMTGWTPVSLTSAVQLMHLMQVAQPGRPRLLSRHSAAPGRLGCPRGCERSRRSWQWGSAALCARKSASVYT